MPDSLFHPIQFCNHFVNLLPADYDMVVAIHDPIPTNYSIDTLCERFRTIEPRQGLRTDRGGGTAADPVALLAKQKGGKSDAGHGKGRNDSSDGKPRRGRGVCWRCGKKGHRQYECCSKKSEKGGQNSRESTANASGNTNASGSGGKTASSDKPGPAKPARGTLLCLMEPCETAFRMTNAGSTTQYLIDSGVTGHYIWRERGTS